MITVLDHPIFHEALRGLRDKKTPPTTFRALAHRAGLILASESTKRLKLQETSVETPLAVAPAKVLAKAPVIIPVLRAGLSLVEPFLAILPEASVGHIGLRRDEVTAQPEHYSTSLPNLSDTDVFVLDPMLATGGSACGALELLAERKAHSLHYVSIIAAPEGIKRLQEKFPQVAITVGVIDERLNEHHFIVPGLGDFGDRLFGTI